jgi:hypothetical protein
MDTPSGYPDMALGYYLRCLEHPGPAERFEFTFAKANPDHIGTVSLATLELRIRYGRSVICSITLDVQPRVGDHVHQFIGLYDDPDPELSRLVASMCHYSARVARLDHGHTVPVSPANPLRSRGIVGTLIYNSAIYPPFEAPWPELLGVKTTLFAVLPLRERELELKRQDGLEALQDFWSAEEKDILHV